MRHASGEPDPLRCALRLLPQRDPSSPSPTIRNVAVVPLRASARAASTSRSTPLRRVRVRIGDRPRGSSPIPRSSRECAPCTPSGGRSEQRGIPRIPTGQPIGWDAGFDSLYADPLGEAADRICPSTHNTCHPAHAPLEWRAECSGRGVELVLQLHEEPDTKPFAKDTPHERAPKGPTRSAPRLAGWRARAGRPAARRSEARHCRIAPLPVGDAE